MIPIDKVCNLIIRVNFPLGLKGAPGARRMSAQMMRKRAEKMMMTLPIRNYDGEVHFTETLTALMDRALGNVKFHEGANAAKDEVAKHVQKKASAVSRRRSTVGGGGRFGKKTDIVPMGSTTQYAGKLYTIANEFASRRIQYAWRKHKSKRRRKLIFNEDEVEAVN
jgi:hypothetical protein